MAPGGSTKGGGHPHHPDLPHEDAETTTHEPIKTTMTTIKEMLTTAVNSFQETFTSSPGGADLNTDSIIPAGDGGANEMTNSSNTDIATMNNMTFSGDGTGGIITSTGTSFEEVTTEITTTLMDEMHNMEHVDESNDYNAVLFIVLGVVLGILIIVAVVLGVIYSHYRKRGFTEISGDHGQVDPQSMKQLQQASSQDALLDK